MVDNIKQKSVNVALIVAGICFFIAFIANWIEENFVYGLLNGVIGGLIIGGITFLISKSAIKNKINFKWWQWVFYIIGWVVGFANLLFWIIMYVAYLMHNYGDPFFSKDFHRRVYIWGIIITIILALTILLILII